VYVSVNILYVYVLMHIYRNVLYTHIDRYINLCVGIQYTHTPTDTYIIYVYIHTHFYVRCD